MPTKIEFSQEEIERIVSLYKGGLGMKKIGKEFSCGHNPIKRILDLEGVKIRKTRNIFTPEQEREIAEAYRGGQSASSITKEWNSHISTVRKIIERHGVPPHRPWQYQMDETAFDTIGEEAAYWWGFAHAEACTQGPFVKFELAEKDANHLEKLKVFLKTERPVYHYEREDSSWSGGTHYKAILKFSCSHIADKFRYWEILVERPTFTIVPMELPREHRNAWLRGFMDGDGCIDNGRPRVRFIGRKHELMWVRSVLAEEVDTNPDTTISKGEGRRMGVLDYSGGRQVRRLLQYLYRDATIWMDRKHEIAQKWLAPPLPRKKRAPQRRDKKGRFV